LAEVQGVWVQSPHQPVLPVRRVTITNGYRGVQTEKDVAPTGPLDRKTALTS